MVQRLISPVVLSVALLSGVVAGVVSFMFAPPTPRHVLELAGATERKSFPGSPQIQMFQLLGFSDNGEFVLTSRIPLDRQGRLQVWNSRSGQLVTEVGIGEFPLTVSHWKFLAALSPDGKYLASLAYTGDFYRPYNLVLWSTTDGKELWRLPLDEPLIERPNAKEPIGGSIEKLRFDPDSRSLWVTTEYRSVQLSLEDRTLLQTIWHAGTLIAFSADGRLAASCSEGWSLLDVRSQRRMAHFPFGSNDVLVGRLEFADEGRMVIASIPGGERVPDDNDSNFDPRRVGLRLFDAVTWMEAGNFPKELLLTVSSDGQRFVSQDGKTLRIRDAVSGGELSSEAYDYRKLPDGSVTAGPNGGFWLWDYRYHKRPRNGVQADVVIRDLATREILGTIPCDATKCAINRQGTQAAAIRDARLELYDWPLSVSYWPAMKFGGICALTAWLILVVLTEVARLLRSRFRKADAHA